MMSSLSTTSLRTLLRRKVRFDPRVERIQQRLRMRNTLLLRPIALKLEILPGDILIDCGANVGDVTSSFARTGAKTYAFEPDPACFPVLSERFSLVPNVTCLQNGVMDRDCSLVLRSPAAHGKWDTLDSSVSSSFVRDDLPEGRQTPVECIDLSNFIKSLGKRVRLLKIDIEGAEIPVINRLIDSGAVDLIDLAVVETHEEQHPSLLHDTNALRDRITALGYASKFRLDWI